MATIIFSVSLLAQQADAQCLVFRVKQLSTTTVDFNGVSVRSSASPTKTSIILLDTDQDFVMQSSEDESGAEDITLSEIPKTSKSPAANSFRHSPAKDEGSFGFWSVWRYGLYSKGSMFYLLAENHQDFGQLGVEQSIGTANGSCWTNKDIGGDLRRSVPKNFTASTRSARKGYFSTGNISVACDYTMTKAVNEHLKAHPPVEIGVRFASKNIVAAREYLIKTYLPAKFPDPFPR